MYRRAFARHRTGAALLLGLSLRAPSASAEPAEPDETRVTAEGKAAGAQQTNDQRVSRDEARVSFALSPRLELPGVAEAALEKTVRGQRSAPGVSSHTREEVRIPGALAIETPFTRGRGSLLLALLSLLSPEVKLDSRDYQARATHEPSARDRFSAFGFGPNDLLGEKGNGILTRFGDAFRPKITFTW